MQDFLDEEACLKARMLKVRDKRKIVGPAFVDLVTRLAYQPVREMDQSEVNALVPVLFLLAEWREPYAYRPTIRLMSRPGFIVQRLLGDHALDRSGFRINASLFDGDLGPLRRAACDPRADEFVRGTFMSALVLVSLAHPERRSDVEKFFRHFRTICPEAPNDVMIDWMNSIAELGMEDMSDSVREAMRKEEIPSDYTDFASFEAKLRETIDGNGVPAGGRYRKFLVSDAISDLLR
jgi:hypothetical protein